MVIRTNMAARTAVRHSLANRGLASKSIEKISTGYRINRAADDVAGLGITEKMATQIREAQVVDTNIQQGYSVTQTADGALQEVTNILQRARELSVQASNGTYDATNDRAALQKEIDSLFGEVNRITKTADYNTIKLFDGAIKKVVVDTTIEIEPAIWGNLDFIKSADFDKAPAAKKATTTLDLVDVKDPSDLVGRAFGFTDVNGTKRQYYFCDNSTVSKVPSGYYPVNIEGYLTTKGFAGVSGALQSINGSYPSLNSSSANVKVVNGSPMQAVFEHNLRGLPVKLTNPPYNNLVADGDGVWGNKSAVSTPPTGDSLLPVDAADNKFMYTNDKEATLDFPMSGSSSLDFTNLTQNTLNLAGFTVKFGSGTSSGSTIYVPQSNCGSKDDIRNYLVSKSPLTSGNRTLTLTADGTNLKLKLVDSTNSLVDTNVLVSESLTWQPDTYTYEDAAGNANSTLTNTVPGTNERNAEYELTIPELTHNTTMRFSDSVNGGFSLYLYDSTQTKVSGKDPIIGISKFDIHGKTKADLEAYIKGRMGSYLNVSSDGDKISFTFPTNRPHTISVSGGGEKAYYTVPGSSTNPVFTNSTTYLKMEPAYIDLDFADYFTGGTLDKNALSKVGFKLNGTIYKFTTTGSPAGSGQTGIDISSCSSIDDLKNTLNNKISGFTATNNGNVMTITATASRTTWTPKLSFVDGIEGVKPLFEIDGNISKLSGGENMGNPETVIDFSVIKTAADVDNLRNTGFRLRCATCPGEFINVLFVGHSTPPIKVPEFYEKEDPPGSGTIVKIKNILIRTDEVDDPTKFAEEIVRQANTIDPVTGKSALDHFTGMRVDPEDPTKLIAFDKRIGNLKDPITNQPQSGRVESGIESDFNIITTIVDEIIDDSIQIYVGSFEKHQYIDIPLKALSLKELDLENASVADVGSSNDLLNRVNTAVNVISSARADIGAANNRLEHCEAVVANTRLNLIAASAQIKDVDMAKEMVTMTKYSLLSESSNAMLAQANTNHQSVLSLLK